MEQQRLMQELNYHRAQKAAEKLFHLGFITVDEYDKLQELNLE